MAPSALREPNMRTALRLPLSPIYIQGGLRLWGALRLPALTDLTSTAPVLLNVVLVHFELTIGTHEQCCVAGACFRHPPQRGGQRLRLCAHGSFHGFAYAQRGGEKAAALGQ